jgi:hypothetical protein
LLAVPMLKETEVVGCIVIFRKEVRPFTDKQIELVKNFGAGIEGRECFVEFAIGQQSGIGDHHGAAEPKHQASVEIELEDPVV